METILNKKLQNRVYNKYVKTVDTLLFGQEIGEEFCTLIMHLDDDTVIEGFIQSFLARLKDYGYKQNELKGMIKEVL